MQCHCVSRQKSVAQALRLKHLNLCPSYAQYSSMCTVCHQPALRCGLAPRMQIIRRARGTPAFAQKVRAAQQAYRDQVRDAAADAKAFAKRLGLAEGQKLSWWVRHAWHQHHPVHRSLNCHDWTPMM